MVSSAVEKNTSEKGDGAPGRGGRLHLPPFGGWQFNKEVKDQVGGEACGCWKEAYQEERSARERPGMFWNSKASVAGRE